ncbi:hypothetical protein E2C01_077142 [Portunus trituberculatus]|uniref:Uncharacterized protein n=1 Tax=Portunus trituberculatus TaxID=210409 RepID=A0A5B7IJK1_PORTR|nr:hypothetical protein [Portunus trituberculatus]
MVENSEDSRAWAREQEHIDPTSSFGMKMRIEKVGGNREGDTVSCLRQLCFSEKKKMRFSKGEMVFYRLKIRSKTVNVAEIDVEKVEGGVKAFGVIIKKGVRPGDIFGPSPEGDSEALTGVPIFLYNFYFQVKGVCVLSACSFV